MSCFPFSFVLLVFTFLSALLSQTAAQICNSIAAGNTATCYTNRATCHYSLPDNRCVNGAPATCDEFLSDQTGCTGSAFGCTWKSTPRICIKTPSACNLITAQTDCVARSDCRWQSNACSSFATGTCRSRTNQVSCATDNCFWDHYIHTCYNSLAEVIAVSPCSTWDNMPLPNTACAYHGCELDPSQRVCNPAGSGGQNATSVSLNMDALFVKPTVAPNSLNFTVQVWLRKQLRNYPAYWQSISIGGGVSGYGAPDKMKPSACNNLQRFNATVGPPYYTAVDNPAGLMNYFDNWVDSNHTFSFPYSNTTFGATLYKILGNLNVKKGQLDTYVSLDDTRNWVIHQLEMNLNTIVDNCRSFGATEVYTTTDRYYTVPIAVIQRDYNNNYDQLSASFYVRVSQTGSVVSVTSSSRYQPVLFRSELVSMTSECPAGEALLQTTYMLQVQNVYAANTFVGPRTTADITFRDPSTPAVLGNCYREYVHNLTRVGCYNSVCYSQIIMRTACRPLIASGQSFNNCSYATAADKTADGVSATGYSPSLDGVHTFWVNNTACPFTASASNSWAGCLDANVSPNRVPDKMTSSILVTLFPSTTLSIAFDIYAGLLPTPTTMDLSLLQVLSQGPNDVIAAPDLFNTQLQWNGIFTFVVGVLDPTIRAIANLTMTVDTLFRIEPLDQHGNLLGTGQVLYISDVFPYMTYVPKEMLKYCEDSGCYNTPATQNQSAYDSFSIPVITLRTLMPANGYSVSVSVSMSIPHSVHATTLSHHDNGMHTEDTEHHFVQKKRRVFATSARQISRTDTFTGEEHMGLMALGTDGTTSANFHYNILVNDHQNPSPPVVLINTTYVPGQNNNFIKGYQVAMRMFVDSTSGVSDVTNIEQTTAYILQKLPIAIAATLGISTSQVINMKAQETAPINGLAEVKGRQLLAVSGTPLYVSFVLLPAPNSTVTVDELAARIVSADTLPSLQVNLYQQHLLLDITVRPQSVAVIVRTPDGYYGVNPQPKEDLPDKWIWMPIVGLGIVMAVMCVCACAIKLFAGPYTKVPDKAPVE